MAVRTFSAAFPCLSKALRNSFIVTLLRCRYATIAAASSGIPSSAFGFDGLGFVLMVSFFFFFFFLSAYELLGSSR